MTRRNLFIMFTVSIALGSACAVSGANDAAAGVFAFFTAIISFTTNKHKFLRRV